MTTQHPEKRRAFFVDVKARKAIEELFPRALPAEQARMIRDLLASFTPEEQQELAAARTGDDIGRIIFSCAKKMRDHAMRQLDRAFRKVDDRLHDSHEDPHLGDRACEHDATKSLKHGIDLFET